MPNSDVHWWEFSLDPEIRGNTSTARLKTEDGSPSVNPPGEHGRHSIDYGQYLGLDQLLSSQQPASNVPDERVFIIIHQLFELVFKQMAFDLGVVAQTFHQVLGLDDEMLRNICNEALPDEAGPSPFWRPAMTAAARLRHSARSVLPSIMAYVGRGEDDDVLFSTFEYAQFRDFLIPASGFQSAQLRLIQRALGKSAYLTLRVFPGKTFGEEYKGCPAGHLSVSDPLVLQSGYELAYPKSEHPSSLVTSLDELGHAVLARLGLDMDPLDDLIETPQIRGEDIERAVSRVRTTMGDREDADQVTDQFASDLEVVAQDENERRIDLIDARKASHELHDHQTCLTFVLDRIVATDVALHAPEPDSFFTIHRKTVKRHVPDGSGTGGGGLPYLVTSQRFLLPMFPALVAYADLRTAGTEDHRELW